MAAGALAAVAVEGTTRFPERRPRTLAFRSLSPVRPGPSRLRPPAGPSASVPPPPPAAVPQRDVALDLLRGLAMVVLVTNHIHLLSALEWVTAPFLSAGETLVCVSGVVVGMVFGRRWRSHGAWATSLALWRRSFEIYRASVCVVVVVGALTLVPGLPTDALTMPKAGGTTDLYDFEGAPRLALAILTLEAGPWQIDVLGFFIAALALAPVILWALARGWWPGVLAASWALFLVGRETQVDVMPAQSEGPFALLVWQLLFTHGTVLGRYRRRVGDVLRGLPRAALVAIVGVAVLSAYIRLHELGFSPFGLTPEQWHALDARHFSKRDLDPARLVSMLSFAAVAYLGLRRCGGIAHRWPGRLLLALGRHSFYVFIVQVFICLAVASVPGLGGTGVGLVGNAIVQLAALGLLGLMIRHRVLFGWIPR